MGRTRLMARLAGRTAIALGLGLSARAVPVHAQISPGKLSRGHAFLEGSASCLKCHEESGPPRAKCQTCHVALGERIDAGKGLHARPEYRECSTCHVEHQGVEAELVWWGKEGRDKLDHRQTGYPLEGKHTGLACPSCHQAKFVQGQDKLKKGGSDPGHTYLGLSTTCASCHADAHRGQFKGKECTSCHSPAGWKPASRFDHAKTAYPLTGRHGTVACDKCHTTTAKDDQGTFRTFKIAARECSSCHEDVHKGRFGAACATCHNTGGFKQQNLTKFDHNRTSYPLTGKHAALVCDKCHTPGRPLRIPFGKCTDCHTDAHLGQLAKRADQGRCESCHDVAGFRPAKFTLEDHQKTSYALAGAHLAVPCDACHKTVGPDTLAKVPGVVVPANAGGRRTLQFRYAGTRCADCHKDPHRGELDTRAGKEGCVTCHKVESWHQIAFDHAKTRFPLTGGHAKVACAPCHPHTDQGKPTERIRLASTPLACADCHKDPHKGQLKKAGAAVACSDCHGTEAWSRTSFDHDRDAGFALDGAHVKLACSACHVRAAKAGLELLQYKPLPRTCKGCHGDSTAAKKGTRP